MKKLIFITIICVFLASPSLADIFVGVDGLTQTNTVGLITYSYASGGEYTIYDSALSINGYVPVTSGILGGANSFQTFCLEVTEHVDSPVDVVLNTSGPSGSQAVKGGTATVDPLDSRTAYLYTQFARGVLSNYDYDNTLGINRAISAKELQEAVYVIENEWVTADGQAAAWILEAQNAIDTGAWSGIGQVRVLNLYAAGTYNTDNPVLLQDQLYMLPVPGAVLLGILGLSAAGIKLRRFA